MNIITELHKYLSASATVTALTSTRLYQTHLPQSYNWASGLTALSMNRISESHPYHLTGSGGVAVARVQIDIWGLTEDQVHTCGEAVRLVLQSHRGVIGGVTCLGVDLDDINSLPEAPIDNSSQWRQHLAYDYLIAYRVPVT